jgi:hypothetical protein
VKWPKSQSDSPRHSRDSAIPLSTKFSFVVVVDQSHISTVYEYSESADSLMRSGLNVKSKASLAETRASGDEKL